MSWGTSCARVVVRNGTSTGFLIFKKLFVILNIRLVSVVRIRTRFAIAPIPSVAWKQQEYLENIRKIYLHESGGQSQSKRNHVCGYGGPPEPIEKLIDDHRE